MPVKCKKCDHFHVSECHYQVQDVKDGYPRQRSCNCRENVDENR